MTDQSMDQESLHDSAGLYVLDALEPEARAEFERHLTSCPQCTEEVRSLRVVATALPYGVLQLDPPAGLKARILADAGVPAATTTTVLRPSAKRGTFAMAGWLSAAALLLISAGVGLYAWSLQQQIGGLEGRLSDALARLDQSEQQVAVATRAVSSAEGRLAVLLAPDMRQVDLAGQPAAPRASGRAFWSRSRGMVFTAANLPQLPPGRTYQLWMVTAQAPVSAGVAAPDASGAIATTFQTSPDVGAPVAIALTIEPEGGLPAPTGDRYLIGLTD